AGAREDQAVDAVLANPRRDRGRVVSSAQYQAADEQRDMLRRQLFFDAAEDLRDPFVLAVFHDQTERPGASEREVARCGPGCVAELLNHLGYARANLGAGIATIDHTGDRALGDLGVPGDLSDIWTSRHSQYDSLLVTWSRFHMVPHSSTRDWNRCLA